MRKVFFIFYFLFFIFCSKSQNLIPNGDFEYYTSCPSNFSQINLAAPWYDPTGATSDYYNGCAPVSSLVSVPDQTIGIFQYAHSGIAYAGLWVIQSNGSNYREYIQVAFDDTLQVGKCYSVAFYANLSNLLRQGANNIGAYISQTAITTAPPNVLNFNPQILLPGNPPITDTLNWIKISGIYQATGGERYITIGNFKDDTTTLSQTVDTTSQNFGSYYYIDDVSIYEIKDSDAGQDTAICNGDSVQIGVTSYDGTTYTWFPAAGLNSANTGTPKASPVQTTTYYLTQTTACGTSTDSVKITVCDVPLASDISVPNIFTPNNDGINDEFKLVCNNVTTLNCKIYNRWGILEGELKAPNDVWYGRTTSGMQAGDGVYFYVLEAKGKDNKIFNEKGFLQLVR
jgi:gliding motility-associated-like protein